MVRHPGEDLVNEECVTVISVLSFQSSSVEAAEFDAPEADRFSRHNDAPLGQQIFNISMAEVKTIVEPDSVGNDIGREPVTFVCIHALIVSQVKLTWQYRGDGRDGRDGLIAYFLVRGYPGNKYWRYVTDLCAGGCIGPLGLAIDQ